MRNTLWLAAALLLGLTGCKKENSNPQPAASSWKLGANTYRVNNYVKSAAAYEAYDKLGNGIIFTFSSFPSSDGNYQVIHGKANTIGSNQVKIVAFGSQSGKSYYTINDGAAAQIKVLNPSVLSIKIPDTWAVSREGDSLKLSAELGSL